MAIIIKRTERASGITGSSEDLTTEGKYQVLQKNFNHALRVLPDYEDLQKELEEYTVELPEAIDIPDISKINQLYAETQSYVSRVTTIESMAISNHTRWVRLCKLMQGYLLDRESEELAKDDIKNLKNSKLQQAEVRRNLKKVYHSQERLEDYCAEAESFKRIVELKKKDLALVLTNLNRQVRALGLERNQHF